MRELSMQEVGMVGGGSDSPPATMGVGCFSALVLVGISPFFGPAMMVGAAVGAISACEDVRFSSS